MKMSKHLLRLTITSLLLVGCSGGSPNPGPSTKLVETNPLKERIQQSENATGEGSNAEAERQAREEHQEKQEQARDEGFDRETPTFEGTDAEPDRLARSTGDFDNLTRLPLMMAAMRGIQALLGGSPGGGLFGNLLSGISGILGGNSDSDSDADDTASEDQEEGSEIAEDSDLAEDQQDQNSAEVSIIDQSLGDIESPPSAQNSNAETTDFDIKIIRVPSLQSIYRPQQSSEGLILSDEENEAMDKNKSEEECVVEKSASAISKNTSRSAFQNAFDRLHENLTKQKGGQ